jgi:hypothetical protein
MSKSTPIHSAISPPSGTGNVAGLGESFSLDLNSGQGNFSVPFDLPDGVAGCKPVIKLEYAHGQGNGPFGLGWRLPLRQMDRRLDFGVPDASTEEIFLDSGTELRLMADGFFHPLRETGFSHYERLGDHWQITERDGARFLLGLSANARVADPEHPERIQSWLLERQEDVNGNGIDYVYERHDGYPFLAEIRYARFVVGWSMKHAPTCCATAAPASFAASRGAAARSGCTSRPTTAKRAGSRLVTPQPKAAESRCSPHYS